MKILDEICEVITCGVAKRPEYVSSGIPFLSSKNVKKDRFILEHYNFISENDYQQLTKYNKPEKGDVLYTRVGSFGEAAVVDFDFKFAVFVSLTLIKPKHNIVNARYLMHYLNSPDIVKLAESSTSGIGVQNLNVNVVRKFPINLPPLPQQQKIANILDTADALRQNDKAMIAKYDELTQALFLDMFGDVISNSKNWGSKKFEEIISLKRGYDLPNNDRKIGDIPVVASTGIVGYHNEVKVKGGCIVTGRSGSIGKVQLITVDCWPLNTSLYGYKTFNNNLVYLKYFVSYFRIERFSHGAGVPTLDRKLVHKELAPFPPIELQNQFAERVAVIEEQKSIAQKSLEKSESLFNSLLQKAFKGGLE
jgi:type I restriction enzyme S subunit